MALQPGGGAPPNLVLAGVPQNLVFAGIVVGLILVLGGIGLSFFGGNSIMSSLTTCVGFGLVLASFGSRAGGSWAGWSATGAGAMGDNIVPDIGILYAGLSIVLKKRRASRKCLKGCGPAHCG